MNKSQNLLILICFFAAFFYCQPVSAYLSESKNVTFLSPADSIKLNLIMKFPTEGQVKNGLVLSQPLSLTISNFGDIYLLDAKESKVFRFNESSDKVSHFGKSGQGPGEFVFPRKIGISKDMIWVFDSTARRIQFYDKNGNFIKMIKLYHRYNDVIADQKGRLVCAKNIKVKEEAKKIIDLLDENGNLILSFGEPEIMDDKHPGPLNDFLVSIFKGKIITASRTTGILKVYNEDGQLVETIDILKGLFKKEINKNINSFKNVSPGQAIASIHLFESIKIFGDAIYFLNSRPGEYEIIRLVEVDGKYNLDKPYKYKSDGLLAIDFDILPVSGSSLFSFYIIDLGEEKSNIIKLIPEPEGNWKK